MRILVGYPMLDLGGAPKTAITLGRGLKERGHDVFFFSRGGGMYEELLDKAGIPLISAPYHSSLPHMYHLSGSAKRLLEKTVDDLSIDVIHVFHPNHCFLALLIAPQRDIPVVFTAVHFLKPSTYPDYPGKVLFVAEEFLEHARPWIGKLAGELMVMPNRVDLDRFSVDVDWSGFAEEKGLPPTGTKLAFMCRLDVSKDKSVYNAMDAAALLAGRGMEVSLAIAGDGPLRDRFEKYAGGINARYGREVVKLLGSVSRTPEFLSWSDVVIGIGRSAFEGMATSKPTCIVGENGLAGVVRSDTVKALQYHNFAGRNIDSPRDPSVLADTIEEIMGDRELYEHLAAYSREYIMENYGYRAGAERLEKIYEELLAAPPLTAGQKRKAVVSSFLTGYCMSLYRNIKWKIKQVLFGKEPGDEIQDEE
jgi:glycosyltransferase involved in cell wall biosynthesis